MSKDRVTGALCIAAALAIAYTSLQLFGLVP